MAFHISKSDISEKENDLLATDTIKYLTKKYFAIFPTHVITFFIIFVELIMIEKVSLIVAVKIFGNALPELFLIQMSG